VNFNEFLPQKEFEKAEFHANAGDLALVLGTSMKVKPACMIPDKIWKKPDGKMVIVNLQKTDYDKYCKLRIFGETDQVLTMLMDELGLTISEFS
jgi:mono-ADP-ribosyltransferase sirtuin 6